MLYIIGLGLGDEKDITLKGLEAVKKCSKVYMEAYTSILSFGLSSNGLSTLENIYGKPIIVADREMVEEKADGILIEAQSTDVAFLVVGDPFGATTHSDLVVRAKKLGVDVKVVHNASVMNAIGVCGLQLYRYGETVSIPFFTDTWRPDSFYEKIKRNRTLGLHTLCLLDIRVQEPTLESLCRGKKVYDPPRFMTINTAIEQLLEVARKHEEPAYEEDTVCVGLARIGCEDEMIVSGPMKHLSTLDFGPPLHCLVIVGETHPVEEEMLEFYKNGKMEEANGGRVKVISVLSVVSSKPIGPGKFHKLSKFDQEMGFRRVQAVFYYDTNPFRHGPMSDQLDNLRISLSQLLNDYPVVTGRLTRDPDDGNWQIKCNDAGVRMVRAKVSVTLDEWLRSVDATEEQDLLVWEDLPQDPSFWSPFRIQINNFECGGLGIGLTCTHMHADLTSAIMLIKSWADVHRQQPIRYPPTMSRPPESHMNTFVSKEESKCRKMASLVKKFSSESVEKWLSKVSEQSPSATPFDVIVALLLSRIVGESESGNKQSISICLDMRNRGAKPIPLGYFGNALHFSLLSIDSIEGGIGNLTEIIRSHIANVKVDDDSTMPYTSELTCINMENLIDPENGQGIMYSAIFEKGSKPKHVSLNVKNVKERGLIIVAPSQEPGHGRTVTITLPEEQISKLAIDETITESL